MNVPDWLWQGLVENAIWAGIAFSAAWAWKHRRMSAGNLKRTPEDVVVPLQPLTLRAEAQQMHVTVSDKLGITDNVLTTVSKGAPSLARRFEELAAWYMHVS
jgi:hypothetical protein